MDYMMKRCLLLWPFAWMLSCAGGSDKNATETVAVNVRTDPDIRFSNVFTNVKYTLLCDRDSFLIGEVDKMKLYFLLQPYQFIELVEKYKMKNGKAMFEELMKRSPDIYAICSDPDFDDQSNPILIKCK